MAEPQWNAQRCLIEGCRARPYAPAGTGALCKEHFLSFVTWRRRKGPAMFRSYSAMTMEQRDAVVAEWGATIKAE
jgi:hypothetical protein